MLMLYLFWLSQTRPVTLRIYKNRCFMVAMCYLIVRRPNLEVVTKRLLHQQVKILEKFRVIFVYGSVSLQLVHVVWIFRRSLAVICNNRLVLREGHKNYFEGYCLMNPQPTFLSLTNFNLMN